MILASKRKSPHFSFAQVFQPIICNVMTVIFAHQAIYLMSLAQDAVAIEMLKTYSFFFLSTSTHKMDLCVEFLSFTSKSPQTHLLEEEIVGMDSPLRLATSFCTGAHRAKNNPSAKNSCFMYKFQLVMYIGQNLLTTLQSYS